MASPVVVQITASAGEEVYRELKNLCVWNKPNSRETREHPPKQLRKLAAAARAFAACHAGFLTNLDLFTPDERDREPIFRDFWRPQGIGWAMGRTRPIRTHHRTST